MPASRRAFARSPDMWPIEAQRFRLVCSETSLAPSRIFLKSFLERPWPWVTMQKRCAPAASAARACSRICSGSIIACIGVSASASRYAEADTPMHAMMEPEQILEHARAAEAAGAHRFCMVTQGQGLSKRDFENILEGAKLVSEQTNLKRCASIGHMSVKRAKALKEAGIQRVHHN